MSGQGNWFDRLLDRLPGWPSERQGVTIAIFGLIGIMLAMAKADPSLWEVETFKDVFKTIVLTGFLNMVLAFHFSANKGDEDKTTNTGLAFKAMNTMAENSGTGATPGDAPPDAKEAAGQVAAAAEDEKDRIVGAAGD